jgi:hypothetical protein
MTVAKLFIASEGVLLRRGVEKGERNAEGSLKWT